MKFLDKIEQARVLVVGDVMLDRYWWGTVSRISPEAPVPIVRLTRSSNAAGGAANVALNIAGLGATPLLVAAVGCDPEAVLLREILESNGVSSEFLLEIESRPTTVKTRIIAHSQQVARVDKEFDDDVQRDQADIISDAVAKLVDDVDAVVISDYAKGLLTRDLLANIMGICSRGSKKVLVDPKGKDYSKYTGADLITPNRREAAEACGLEDSEPDCVEHAGRKLISEHKFESVLITRGEEGMTLFRRDSEPLGLPAMARQVYDVTGAGDTVIATLAAAIASGSSVEDAASAANVAAGLVVEHVGTTSVRLSDLKAALNGQ